MKKLQTKQQKEFQRQFINHKNSVVKIINSTFKRIKTNKINRETK